MTARQEDRLEGTLIGLLVGLHAAGAVYRWVRGHRTDAAWHGGCALVEAAALWRHREVA